MQVSVVPNGKRRRSAERSPSRSANGRWRSCRKYLRNTRQALKACRLSWRVAALACRTRYRARCPTRTLVRAWHVGLKELPSWRKSCIRRIRIPLAKTWKIPTWALNGNKAYWKYRNLTSLPATRRARSRHALWKFSYPARNSR